MDATLTRTLNVVGFGTDVVDESAYPGYIIPPLRGAANDAVAWALAAKRVAGFASTAVTSQYAGSINQFGGYVNPTLQLNSTVKQVEDCITARAEYVKSRSEYPTTTFIISGHGTQHIWALGSEESLVLADGLLPDWRVAESLASFPDGSKVALIVDTCHSGGTLRRADARTLRFTHGSKFADCPLPFRHPRAVDRGAVKANVRLFAACAKSETALDGPINGAFSGTWLAVLAHLMDARIAPAWDSFVRTRQQVIERYHHTPTLDTYNDPAVWSTPIFT